MPPENERRITVDQSTAENVAKVLGIVQEIRSGVDEVKRRMTLLEQEFHETREQNIRDITTLQNQVGSLTEWKKQHEASHAHNDNKRGVTFTHVLMTLSVVTSIVLGVLALTK